MAVDARDPIDSVATSSKRAKLFGLRRWNASMAALHLLQALIILAIASSFSLPVTSSFLQLSSMTDKLVPVQQELFRVRIGPLVAAFLLISALAHALLVSPGLHRRYERNALRGIDTARRVEYSLSSSLMTAKSLLARQVFAGTLQPA